MENGLIIFLESRKRKVEHTDSDGDDEFFDRTGEVERKRIDKEGQQTQTFSYGELVSDFTTKMCFKKSSFYGPHLPCI